MRAIRAPAHLRVLLRAQGGGHGASEGDVRSIYEASLANLGKAVATFHSADIYDSTPFWAPPRLIATATDGQVVRLGSSPAWLERALSAGSS